MMWLLMTILVTLIFSWVVNTSQGNKIIELKQELVDQKAEFVTEYYIQVQEYENQIQELKARLHERGYRAKI